MRLYRVVPWHAESLRGEPGHPLWVDVERQGAGRFDNPRHYRALYLAETPQGAVGERFGDAPEWSPEMLTVRFLPGAVFALATLEAEPEPEVLDLDDAAVLVELNRRPSQVAGRNREVTREVALGLWSERRAELEGLRWWSYWRPEWHNRMLWAGLGVAAPWSGRLEIVEIEELTLDHPAVQIAAGSLRRVVTG